MKSWVKALLIAFPISVLFGPIAMIGFLLGLDDITRVYFTKDSWDKEVNWWIFISGSCGLLGLIGIWLSLILEYKLKTSSGYLNKLVSLLLFIGIFGLFNYIIGILMPSNISASMILYIFILFCIFSYGIRLLYGFLRKTRVREQLFLI